MTTLTRRNQFEVIGLPAPQGSKSAVSIGGKARIIEGRSTAQRAKHKAWRGAVAQAAHDLTTHDDPTIRVDQYTGPTKATIAFEFPRPKTRPRRHHGWHTVPPDADKVLRSTLDGLKDGGLIADDKLICWIEVTCTETTGWTGATITLEAIE